jgi:hypothetical protein
VTNTAECTWRCKDGYFASAGGCERCMTFDETAAALSVSGERAAGTFYRFKACSEKAQARSEACSPRDFNVEGTYVADGPAFDEDCVLQCADNSNRHSVRVNATKVGPTTTSVWRARVCQTCPTESWPAFANRSLLPRAAFEMSLACEATCLSAAGFFPSSAARTCLFCPRSACATGAFWSPSDNCTRCQTCTRRLQGGSFVSNGLFDNATSCAEQCPTGSFASSAVTCTPHSVTACRIGVEYAIAGTPTADARCGACADCSFARETKSCTLTSNRQCASCGPLDAWSSTWSKTGCELVCRSADGYTKLYTPAGEVCRKCLSCPVGYELPAAPANCSCQPCREPIPAKAVYTTGCMWTCPLYHVAQRDPASRLLVCEYTLRLTTNAVQHLRVASPVSCRPGQRLVPAAHAGFECANCTTPPGMRLADLNVTWTWGSACAWQCAWNLEKQETSGVYACATIVYNHPKSPKPPSPIPRANGLQLGHIIGLAASFVVVLLFGLCFLQRMLPH